jgi:hypothetical protein
MATTPIDSWAVDLANVTTIYPWVGSEKIMAAVAIVLWIVWHVWQVRFENAKLAEEQEKHGHSEAIQKVLSGD